MSHQIQRHLRQCPECARERDALAQTVRLIRQSEEFTSVSTERLEQLQSQVLDALDQRSAATWVQQATASLRLHGRTWSETCAEWLDRGTWLHRLRIAAAVVLLVFAGIWVDRQYFRPTLPEMIREVLVPNPAYVPATMGHTSQAFSPRQFKATGRETNSDEEAATFATWTDSLVNPLPVQTSDGMEVRAVELRDGRLLFVGTLSVEVAEESTLEPVTVPTENPTVVMLPRRFEEPAAPSRGHQEYLFTDLLERLAYPVASPTDLVIEDEAGQ